MTEEQKNKLTFRLMKIMELWQLSNQEKITLLDLKSLKSRNLYLYGRGDKSFDFDDSVVKRAEIILGIHESLGTTYPVNRDYAAIWLKRQVKKFKHKVPLEMMLSGEIGMKRVWHFLDCTQGWKN